MSDTTSMTDLKARAAVTAGLRALAEFLDAHPTLPVPRFSTFADLTVYPAGSQEAVRRPGRLPRRRGPRTGGRRRRTRDGVTMPILLITLLATVAFAGAGRCWSSCWSAYARRNGT
jgi:hypothetical protein